MRQQTSLFAIKHYNDGILHYDRMDFAYYKAIYLHPHVTDEDRAFVHAFELHMIGLFGNDQ